MTILEDLKAGRLVVVPPVSVKLLLEWADDFAEAAKKFERLEKCVLLTRAQECRDAAASPDHTTALLSLVEGMERERGDAEQALRTVQNAAKTIASAHGTELEHLRQNARFDHALRAEVESIRQHGSEMTDALLAAEARALAAEAERDALREALAPFAEAGEMAAISGQPPGYHVDANAFTRAARALTEKNNG